MTTKAQILDAAMTVDEITNAHPETFEVFSRFGMDICCGGGVPLAEAAARDGADLDAVLRALRDAVEPLTRTK